MVTREELYRLVWTEPMTKVAAQFDVSGTYLARVCTVLNVPRPPRGFWSKLAVGKAPPAEALPDALPGDQLTWNEKGGRLPPLAPAHPARGPSLRQPRKKVGAPAQGMHPLIRSSRSEFLRSRPVEKGGYLKPFKKLLPDVTTSETCLDRALDLASKLYNELEALGARVVIAPGDRRWHGMHVDERETPKKERDRYHHTGMWSPIRPTLAFFDDVAIALVIVEMSEEVLLRYVGGDYIRETEYQAKPWKYREHHTWTTSKDLPSGRLRVVAFSPEGVQWSLNWQEKGTTTLDASLPRIAKEIRAAIPTVVAQVEEASRQAEIRHQEWLAAEERRKREEDRRRIKQSIKESREQLGEVIERWAERMAVERFFDELSQAINELPGTERAGMTERLRLAREFMRSRDPMDFFRVWRTPREIHAPIFDHDVEPEGPAHSE